MNLDLNKAYYYIICLMAAFIFLWGTIDLVSSSASYVSAQVAPAISSDKIPDEGMENFYQKKVAQDRFLDSLSRMLISGIVFAYCRKKVS